MGSGASLPYGQLWVSTEGGKGTARKFALKNPDGAPVQNLTQAKEAPEVLKHARREEALPVAKAGRTGFSGFAARARRRPRGSSVSRDKT